jgi:hypothetical protein
MRSDIVRISSDLRGERESEFEPVRRQTVALQLKRFVVVAVLDLPIAIGASLLLEYINFTGDPWGHLVRMGFFTILIAIALGISALRLYWPT